MSEDGSGAVDSVKEAFQGKRGKILIVGGGIAIAGYVWWTRRNGTPQPVPADTGTTPTTADGPSGRTPQTAPEVGNTNTGSATGPRKYANNADWLADGTSFLQGRGTPAGAAYDALTKALAGLTLTAQQIAWVSQVIGALGAPPEGMPPLNAAAPPGNPQGGGPKPPGKPKPPVKPKPHPKPHPKPTPHPKPKPTAQYAAVPVTRSPSAHSTISGIAASYHKPWQSVWNDPKNSGLRARRPAPNKIQPGDIVYVKK